jgi:hypothetical protein
MTRTGMNMQQLPSPTPTPPGYVYPPPSIDRGQSSPESHTILIPLSPESVERLREALRQQETSVPAPTPGER